MLGWTIILRKEKGFPSVLSIPGVGKLMSTILRKKKKKHTKAFYIIQTVLNLVYHNHCTKITKKISLVYQRDPYTNIPAQFHYTYNIYKLPMKMSIIMA